MTTIDLGQTVITPTSMTVTVIKSVGIKSWLGIWTHQGDDFQDGRDFIAQERELAIDAPAEVSEGEAPPRKTKSGTIRWDIRRDGLYEFVAPTTGTSMTRGFLRVENGEITRLPYTQKSHLLAALPPRPRHGRRSADADF